MVKLATNEKTNRDRLSIEFNRVFMVNIRHDAVRRWR